MSAGTGKLVALSAKLSNDEGFAAEHIECVAEVEYEKVAVKYIVWVFPHANGFRAQLKIRKLEGAEISGKLEYDITPNKMHLVETAPSKVLTGRTEFLPVATAGMVKRGIGYYNYTQGRNQSHYPLLHEEEVGNGILGWASILSLEDNDGGIVFVKESHKCANQSGVNTGVFEIADTGVGATGWGILPQDLTTAYQGYWANWLIVHEANTAEGRELAIKQFDRTRYPLDPKRDIYIMANTWGSGDSKNQSQIAAQEKNVIAEINSQVDLGIDVQQIDDGWQGRKTGGDNWRPVPELQYDNGESYPMYPEGWATIRACFATKGIRPGLWCHNEIPLEDLKWNFDQGGFLFYKIDFIKADNFNSLDEVMDKIREFVKHTNHQVRINWDVTEHPARMGYFFGREYGNIYLENRKTRFPENVVYVPYLVLRDAWHLAKYTNLNKFQITVQNGDRCNPKLSDANRHPHDYLTAQTLMGSPIFFQETHLLSDKARAQIRPVLAAYKKVRDEMYQGYVFPIGDEPDNKSWSGFQNVNPERNVGFITLFRQIENKEATRTIKLKFVQGQKLEFADLMNGDMKSIVAGPNGEVEFSIDQPAGFGFYSYNVYENRPSCR